MGKGSRPAHRAKTRFPKLSLRDFLPVAGMLLLAAALLFPASSPGRVLRNRPFLASGFGGAEVGTRLRRPAMSVGKR